jgi:capsule polysaccharide export protein KpsE/RkpR
LSNDVTDTEGVDALTILTPLIEERGKIFLGVIGVSLVVAVVALAIPRKYKAELSVSPVVSSKSGAALGGIAALAGATLQNGYQLTPARMVELIKSRAVLSGVGYSQVGPSGKERIIDRVLGKQYTLNDAEDVENHLSKLVTVTTSKETGTVTLAVEHPDSALARLMASRIVDSASQIFVRTSKAQAQQLRIAQEARVANAAAQLASAEDRLREFSFGNRVSPVFSTTGLERDRLDRGVRFAEQVYTQAATEREDAFARELEATPTVVMQDPLPPSLPRVRKRIIMKTVIAAVVTSILLSVGVILADLTGRRLKRSDQDSERFQKAVSTLPRFARRKTRTT